MQLQKLSLQSQGLTWQLAPGAQPSVEYANNAVAVSKLTLVNGNQQIAADGAFRQTGRRRSR